jgi:hypothetical protein
MSKQLLMDLEWGWLPQAFRHCLVAALDFLCLKDL